jgi:hypothetical protein
MTRFDQPIYEYACHEANYSLTNILRGGRTQFWPALRKPGTESREHERY